MPDDGTTQVPDTGQEQEQEENIRHHPAFLAIVKQVTDLKAQLEADKVAKEQAAKDAEQKKLEEKGEYELIIQQKAAELEALKKTTDKNLREMALKFELAQRGVTDEVYIDGAIYRDDGMMNPGEYAAEVAKRFSESFAQPSHGVTPPGPVSPASAGKTNWAQVRQDLRDPKKAREAGAKIQAYVEEHGKPPPG